MNDTESSQTEINQAEANSSQQSQIDLLTVDHQPLTVSHWLLIKIWNFRLSPLLGFWTFRTHLCNKNFHFIKYPYKYALYIKGNNGDSLIVSIYVDDLIFTRSNPSLFKKFKRWLISNLWRIISVLKLNKRKKTYYFLMKLLPRKYSRSLRCMIAIL